MARVKGSSGKFEEVKTRKQQLGQRRKVRNVSASPSQQPEEKKSAPKGKVKQLKTNDGRVKPVKAASPEPEQQQGGRGRQKKVVSASEGSGSRSQTPEISSDVQIIEKKTDKPQTQKKGRQPKVAEPVVSDQKAEKAGAKSQKERKSSVQEESVEEVRVKTTGAAQKGQQKTLSDLVEFRGDLEKQIRNVILSHQNSISLEDIISHFSQEYFNVSVSRINSIVAELETKGSIYLSNKVNYSLVRDEVPIKPAKVVEPKLTVAAEEVQMVQEEEVQVVEKETEKDSAVVAQKLPSSISGSQEGQLSQAQSEGQQSSSKRGRPPKSIEASASKPSVKQTQGESEAHGTSSALKSVSQAPVAEPQAEDNSKVVSGAAAEDTYFESG